MESASREPAIPLRVLVTALILGLPRLVPGSPDSPAGPPGSAPPPMALRDWKPANPRIQWNGPVAHEPRDSELLVALMALKAGRTADSATLDHFITGFPRQGRWRDSAAVFRKWLLDEKRRLREQVFHVDFYHPWPAYDQKQGGFPMDIFKAGSCGYYDNFRGITADGPYSFDFGKHVKASGLPTRFLLSMDKERAKEVAALADSRGKLLLRVYFRYAGISSGRCRPDGLTLRWNDLRLLKYEIYPPPAGWGEPPDRDRRLAQFPEG